MSFPPKHVSFDVRVTVHVDDLPFVVEQVKDALDNLAECNEIVGFNLEGHTAEGSIMTDPLFSFNV